MNPALPNLIILLLAAGFSSRLGRPKALARVHGVTLLRRTLLTALALRPGKVVVVVPSHFERYRIEARGLRVDFARNPLRSAGLSSSVRCGIDLARGYAGALLLPVDLPWLESRELSVLVRAWRAHPTRIAATRVSARGGVPLILPRRCYARSRIISGDAGLRQLLNTAPASRSILVELPSALFDVDTAQDLLVARRSHKAASRG